MEDTNETDRSKQKEDSSPIMGIPKQQPGDCIEEGPRKKGFHLDFGEALQAAKKGATIARDNWNGKNMGVYVTKGGHDFGSSDNGGDTIRNIKKSLYEKLPTDSSTTNPRFDMIAADGTIIVGWVPSQTDLLSEDWVIVSENPVF